MVNSNAILIVDDSRDDRFLLKRSLGRAGVLNPICEVGTGAEAIAYLDGSGVYADRSRFPFPGILLLDLDMPDVDGFRVLQWIRDKFSEGRFLVVVLSRLDEIKSINRAYSLGASSFLTKPGNETDLDGLIRCFRDYWIVRNHAPEGFGEKPHSKHEF